MTAPEQARPTTTAPVGTSPRHGHVMDVFAALRDRGPARHEPARVRADHSQHLLELEFDDGPTSVVAWAAALRFDRPDNQRDELLRQTIVQASGVVFGWRVELRHVHTVPAAVTGRRRAS